MSRSRRAFAIIVAALIVAAALVGWRYLLSRETGAADRLQLSGTVEARTTEVGSEVGGRVVRLVVRQGDRVAEGDLIAEIASEIGDARLSQAEAARDASEQLHEQASVATSVQGGVARAQVARAERAVETAQARLAELVAGARPEIIAEAEARLRQAEEQVKVAGERLAALERGPREQEIEQARAAVERAAAAVRAAEARVDELKAGTREQDVQQAEAAVAKARAAAEKAGTDAERMDRLHQQGVVSTDQLERAQTAARAADEDLRAAEAVLDRAREGPRSEHIRMAEADLAQTQAQQRQAQEALALLHAGTRPEEIRAARAQLAQAEEQAEAGRQHLAALRAGPTPAQIAVASRLVSEARAAVRLARQRAREVSVTAEQADAAAADAERADAVVAEAEFALDKHVVLAPGPGVVDSLNIEQGEVASPGASLVTLVNPDDLWVRVYVPEPDLVRVRVGRRARVQVDGQREPFQAEIIWIAEQAEFTPKYIQTRQERTRLVYAVKVRPEDPRGRLKPGMPADVTILLD